MRISDTDVGVHKISHKCMVVICWLTFFSCNGSRLAYNNLSGQVPGKLYQVASYKYCAIIVSYIYSVHIVEKSLHCPPPTCHRVQKKKPPLTPKSDILYPKLLKPFDLPHPLTKTTLVFTTSERVFTFFPPSNCHSKNK